MNRTLLNLYFIARASAPAKFRIALRRLMAKRQMRRLSGAWAINQLANRPPEWWTGWPDGKKFAFVLSHDVERKKGLGRCNQLAELEMSLQFRSSFNFVPEGEYELPRDLRDFLTGNGFEVGVHDLRHDGLLYTSENKFKKSAQKINHYLEEWGAVGFRSGFMLHNLDWIRNLNVLYDASTFDTDPFEPQPDGMNTIFPFWVSRSDGSGYVELPYTLPQDSTLFLILTESGIDTWVKKLDWVAANGGLALLNVHPDYTNFLDSKQPGEYSAHLYRDFLQHVSQTYKQEAWFALPKDVAAYVRDMKARAHAKSTEEKREQSTAGALARSGMLDSTDWNLRGKKVGMVLYSHYPSDPRPRRAAEALVSKGMKVDLICLAEEKNNVKREIINGIEIRRLPIRRRRGSVLRYCFEYGSFLTASAAILAFRQFRRGYDLVYAHNMPDFLVFSGLVPKIFGAKVILDLHDPMPELMTTIFGLKFETWSVRLLKRLEAWSMAFADAVVTANLAFAKLFISRGCPAGKMNVVMNSPDERIFDFRPPSTQPAKSTAPDRPFVIMYHGSLVERNGLDLAVEAFARVRDLIPAATLRIYGGRTPFLDRVMDSIKDREWKEAVQYLGPKSLEELVTEIEKCDVGIIPNHRSTFTELNMPTRIFEYLVIGKPAIAPNSTGIRDYFGEGSLVFFELGNAEDLARKIEYVHDHPSEVTEIVRRGQEIYQEHPWTIERYRLTSLVAQLLDDEPVPSAAAENATP